MKKVVLTFLLSCAIAAGFSQTKPSKKIIVTFTDTSINNIWYNLGQIEYLLEKSNLAYPDVKNSLLVLDDLRSILQSAYISQTQPAKQPEKVDSTSNKKQTKSKK